MQLRKQQAFTLIELLVTILLIVIILSMVQLSVGGDKQSRLVKQESERLATLIQLASDEAVMMGQEMGLFLLQQRYQFYQLTEAGWVPYQDNRIFRERALPEGAVFTLYQQGMPVKLSEELPEKSAFETESESLKPQIFILSSGERSPFELEIGVEDQFRSTIKAQIYGDLEISFEAEDDSFS